MVTTHRKCPDEARLAALVGGELAETLTMTTLEHLEGCETCRSTLLRLENADPILRAMRDRSPIEISAVKDPHLPGFLKAVRNVAGPKSDHGGSDGPFPEFDRYEIAGKAGAGGMGTVYIAEDRRLRRKVAVKVPHRSGKGLARFQQEAKTLAGLDHPNICPIYDVDLAGAPPHLAMKFIDGITLAQKLKRGSVAWTTALEWSIVIARTLAYAHDKGIVHRDLKPGNIMIDSAEKLWLMDFGLSKLLSQNEGLSSDGEIMGTPAYMAPEQIDPKLAAIGPATDVYSLGVMTYELLTGQRPFQGDPVAVFSQIRHDTAVPPSKLCPGLDRRIDGVLAKAMEKLPLKRHASAIAFADELTEILATQKRPSPPKKQSSSRIRLVVLAVLFAVGGIWMAYRPGSVLGPTGASLPTSQLLASSTPDAPSPAAPPAPDASPTGKDSTSPKTPNNPPPPAANADLAAADPAEASSGENPPKSADAQDQATHAVALLGKYCYACHADDKKYPGLDMRDRVTLLRPADPNEAPFLTPGKPEASRIIQQLSEGRMPPEDQPQPTVAEGELIRAWITAGAVFPDNNRPKRPFVGEQTLLAIIDKDLQAQPSTTQPFLRYLTLTHLWNSSASDEHLRLVRAAVSKLINGLSSESQITLPSVVDGDGLVLRIDLRDYGWKAGRQWLSVSKAYPYGLVVPGEAYRRVTQVTGDFPYLRADWFVYTASRPPLYDQLLTLPDAVGLPDTQSELEKRLSIDLVGDYARDRLKRAAFTGEESGVSDHNRMVERHPSKYGYYWPSYDFQGDTGRQSLFRFPLGPKALSGTEDDNFEHDGGEIIFSLPNGLQGYMLAKADGSKLDVGPQTIVRDANQHSGSYDVINGISCIGCHRHGMVRFTDTLRAAYVGSPGEVADRVLRIYPENTEMSKLVEADRQRFLLKLEEAIGPFLRADRYKNAKTEDFPEPITTVARQYGRDVRLADVARELGLPDEDNVARGAGIRSTAAELPTVIRVSDTLRLKLALGPIATGGAVSRRHWEEKFGQTARELGVGTPKKAN